MSKNFLVCAQQHYGGNVVDLKAYENFIDLNFNYILIYHDNVKETDLHFHCILINCDETKKQLLSYFPTADIQQQISKNKQAYNYLLHKGKKYADKVLYDESKIISNYDIKKFLLEDTGSSYQRENELLNEIVDFILDNWGRSISYLDILSKYKGVALKYKDKITDLLNLSDYNIPLDSDEILQEVDF